MPELSQQLEACPSVPRAIKVESSGKLSNVCQVITCINELIDVLWKGRGGKLRWTAWIETYWKLPSCGIALGAR
ncbi:hypothetical protein F01_460637 [Burkholderia cenocepacia]|nr:hypothetical protein F01_460637 [Burkholderia cenocepacia]